MKIKHLLLLLIIFCSCEDDVSDEKYRNENYVFYKEDGKVGKWQKISKTSNFKYKKGYLTYFYSNGNKFGKLEIIDSFPNRIEQFYDKYEKHVKTIWREEDSIVKIHLENGYFKHSYSSKGIIIMEGLVENNLEQGIWKKYRNEDGTLRQIIEMKDGLEHGKREDYWANGKLKSVSFWNMGKQIGEGTIYFENGNVKTINFVKKGKLHGVCKVYYSNGNLKSSDKYWYGEKCDTSKIFYKNGNIKKLQTVNLDTVSQVTTGREFRYFPNGKLQAEIDFRDFKANGDLIIYNENGVIIEKSKKVNNKHQGAFITFYDSGIKQLEGNANKGFYDGKLKYYDKNGNLTKTVNYDNGTALDSIMN